MKHFTSAQLAAIETIGIVVFIAGFAVAYMASANSVTTVQTITTVTYVTNITYNGGWDLYGSLGAIAAIVGFTITLAIIIRRNW